MMLPTINELLCSDDYVTNIKTIRSNRWNHLNSNEKLRILDKLTEEQLVEEISLNMHLLRIIPKPTEQMKLVALRQDFSAIWHFSENDMVLIINKLDQNDLVNFIKIYPHHLKLIKDKNYRTLIKILAKI